jgi:TrmH family RNA methyltransferase
VARAVRLKKRALREKDRRFLVEGAQGVREAVASAAVVHDVFHSGASDARREAVLERARSAGVPVNEVSADIMARLTSAVTPQGIVAVSEFVDVPMGGVPEEATSIPVLVEVRDPGNAGTIVRSADAAGADAVVFTRSSVDAYNPKAVRASAGSIFHLPVVREAGVEEAVDRLRARGFRILAATARGELSVYEADLTGPTAFLFGNEAHGLDDDHLAMADQTIRVPISGGAESLNLAAATALVLFESARQRSGAAPLAAVVAASAHDIRSPLSAVLGFTSTMLHRWSELDEAQRRAMVEAIAHDGKRMRAVVAQLVDAARLSTGTLGLSTERVDVGRVVGLVAGDREDDDPKVSVSGEGFDVQGDPERLRTVIGALVDAAAWWGDEGPIEVRLEDPVVVIRRAAREFTPDQAEQLLRVRAPGGGGSTVGLSVAHGLSAAMGHVLTVEARDGVRFTLDLGR